MTARPTQAVILAGGRGTRLQPLTDSLPKALAPFSGTPFLGHVMVLLREQGFERVLLLLGYRADAFTEHFGDGSAYGLTIDYDVTDAEDLTSYRMQHAADQLDDTFFLLYCDNYLPFRFDRLWAHRQATGAPALVTVYANRDGYTQDSVIVRDGMVTIFDRGRTTPGLAGVEVSYALLDREAVLPLLPTQRQEPFEAAVYPQLAAEGKLAAWWTEHRYYSVGGYRRLPLTSAFFRRKPTVILDRDGVLNVRPPKAQYVTSPREWRWMPGALESLARLAAADFRVIVVSNQAGIERGQMTEADLAEVHGRMRYEVAEAGGWIEAVYHCPHDWDAGCACRKPAPGMLLQAQRDHHLDLTRTFFIGDDERDAQAAAAAGAPAALVDEQRSLAETVDRLLAGELEDCNP